MKRDMGDLRQTLLAYEAGEQVADDRLWDAFDAGLVGGTVLEWSGKRAKIINGGITPLGHDFLALARNDAIWNRVAAFIAERVGDTSWANWMALLEREHKAALELLAPPAPEQEPVKEPDADSVSHSL